MYGYIKPQTEELLVKDHRLYRAFYCGLCRSMRRQTGTLSALTLREEMLFLALCRTLYEEDETVLRRRRCPVHPCRRVWMAEPQGALRYAARASAILAEAKNRDDRRDGTRRSRLRAFFLSPFFAYGRRRARLPELTALVERSLFALFRCEAERAASVDRPASLFGETLAAVFSFDCVGEQKETLYRIGYHLGRLLYIADAAADRAKDRKSGDYNPYLLIYPSGADAAICEDVRASLRAELYELCEASAALPYEKHPRLRGILENLLQYGLPASLEAITARSEEGETPGE